MEMTEFLGQFSGQLGFEPGAHGPQHGTASAAES